jgi:hypothetical protein
MVIFAIFVMMVSTLFLGLLISLLIWSKPPKKKPKQVRTEKLSRDLRETQVLPEEIIDTKETLVMDEEEFLEHEKNR